jgi:hypothetical protein
LINVQVNGIVIAIATRRDVMHSDNASTDRVSDILSSPTLYRGLYVRVARKLGVDPSYVSRVARRERSSRQVETALRREIQEISVRLGRRVALADEKPARGEIRKRLRFFISHNRPWIRQEWLRHSQADATLRRIDLSARKRTSPISSLVDEALRLFKFTPKEMAASRMKAAEDHGRLRRSQEYTATALAEEYNLIRRCIFVLAEKHFDEVEPRMLLHDLAQLGEALDLQMQTALKAFLAKN